MRIRKEAELNTAILHFLAKCVAEGDDQTLAYLGLDRNDAEAIESLQLTDIDHLSSVHFPLLRKASIDRDLMHRLIERVRAFRQSTSVRDELLTLDAPFPLMQALFGMDASEYAARGWRLQVRRHSGRPADPRADEEAAVWQALSALSFLKALWVRFPMRSLTVWALGFSRLWAYRLWSPASLRNSPATDGPAASSQFRN